MSPDFFDPSPEEQVVILVQAAILRTAERMIESCAHRNSGRPEIPFEWILDRITGADPRRTDYLLEEPAKCPNCRREIVEKTSLSLASEA